MVGIIEPERAHMRFLAVFVAVLALAGGCATVEHTEQLAKDRPMAGRAGVGDVIARVDRQRNLENAFGKADLFGRKTNEGFAELRFAGLTPAGEVVLYRTDTAIITNETTMSRTPISSTFVNANANRVGGQTNVTGVATTISPTSDYHAVVPAGSVQIIVPKGTSAVPFEGHNVAILEATPVSLSYQVQ